ncbi:amino acid ABC transporter ATP-binding protein [Pseudonocardiaceae bacterium YIM PH 21723]|nr:amino acid ABC transporter ATP-binding protein [Pseudonocardiaceae bacterium YIM PH 21723]
MTEDFITFRNVSKRFGKNVVLDDLCFSVRERQRITLIGPSGSGKTTILRMLMTLMRPDSGLITVGGDQLFPADEQQVARVRRRMTMVFQQYNLFPNMNVLRNITMAPMKVLGVPEDEAVDRARKLLELVGLTAKLSHYPSQLSGGQQQRVAIARALAMQPDVLLLDEVTAALDPELAAEVLDVLRDVADSLDVTMLCVTHAMRFARDISDQVLMFCTGKIIESGPPEQILEAPQHERTQRFLRSVLEEV